MHTSFTYLYLPSLDNITLLVHECPQYFPTSTYKKKISHFPIKNRKASIWMFWRDNAWWQEVLKVKIETKSQRLFVLFVPCLENGALYRTVPPKNVCMFWSDVSSPVRRCPPQLMVHPIAYPARRLRGCMHVHMEKRYLA